MRQQEEKRVEGRRYDSTGYYWALMYKPSGRAKPHIVALYPHGNDARREATRINHEPFWSGKKQWSTKRFKLYFRGTEVDMYEHLFSRVEKPVR